MCRARFFDSPPSLAPLQGDEGDAVADDARAGAGTAAEAPQLFLQAFLGQGAMRRAAAAELVQRINVRCGIAGTPLQAYIDDANRKLEAANLFLSLKRYPETQLLDARIHSRGEGLQCVE